MDRANFVFTISQLASVFVITLPGYLLDMGKTRSWSQGKCFIRRQSYTSCAGCLSPQPVPLKTGHQARFQYLGIDISARLDSPLEIEQALYSLPTQSPPTQSDTLISTYKIGSKRLEPFDISKSASIHFHQRYSTLDERRCDSRHSRRF